MLNMLVIVKPRAQYLSYRKFNFYIHKQKKFSCHIYLDFFPLCFWIIINGIQLYFWLYKKVKFVLQSHDHKYLFLPHSLILQSSKKICQVNGLHMLNEPYLHSITSTSKWGLSNLTICTTIILELKIILTVLKNMSQNQG